jgi:hypothetical protein
MCFFGLRNYKRESVKNNIRFRMCKHACAHVVDLTSHSFNTLSRSSTKILKRAGFRPVHLHIF